MKVFSTLLFVLSLPCILLSATIFVPTNFQNGQVIDKILLFSDVDGVIRDSTEAVADPRIIASIKNLLLNENVEVVFISGTPVVTDRSVEEWRRGNVSLSKVFEGCFDEDIKNKRVTIFGSFGGQKLTEFGEVEVLDEYNLEMAFELGKLLIRAFLEEVLSHGTINQKHIAIDLQEKITLLKLNNFSQPACTIPSEFSEVANIIRDKLDPDFRLLHGGTLIETHTSSPLWSTKISSDWLKVEIEKPEYAISQLMPHQKKIDGGFAKRHQHGFNFLQISKTHKGIAVQGYIESHKESLLNTLIVSIGDSNIDFPMHYKADLAFHVGGESTWKNNPLPQCIMVCDNNGFDRQHVQGTLQVLEILNEGFGKSINDIKFNFIPDNTGKWNCYSINEAPPESSPSKLNL